MKKRVQKVCAAVTALISATVLTAAAVYVVRLDRQEARFSCLRETAAAGRYEGFAAESEEAEPEAQENVSDKAGYDFAKLRETNDDIYAWITVPGTQIDYPVLQNDTDDYYLERNLDHTKGYPGCIYSNSCNSREFTDLLTVLYGHNMKNGSMFGCLHDYKEADFFRQNSEILVYTETQCLKYEIVAAAEFSDLYLTDYYGVDDENGRNAFLSELKQNAAGQTGSRLKDTWADENMPGDSERYLILSTCVDGHDELRYLVTGRLVEEITW